MADALGLSEFELIQQLFAPLAEGVPGAFGLRDDAAVVEPQAGQDLVVTKDAMVAGVHFLPDDPPDLIARKLLRVNLSDLAAKGARPFGYLMATAFPADITRAWLEAFVAGLAADQAVFGIRLLGGDTVATPGPMTLSLTAFGHVPAGRMIRRAGAEPGDALYVTGTIGDSVLGLAARRREDLGLAPSDAQALVSRYQCPEPRVAFGVSLIGIAHAALDVSDGLLADVGHLAAVSGVRAVVNLAAVPLSRPAAQWVGLSIDKRLRLVSGGDDYEIVFAAPPGAVVSGTADTPVTAIGRIEAGQGVRLVDGTGTDVPVASGGYRHF